jgi:hypothetical protein
MPGQVHHLEGPVAEVDDVPFADLADLRARLLAKRSGREPRRLRRHEQRFVHVIPGPFEHRDLLLPPRLPRAERPQRRAAQQPSLKAVSPDMAELVMTADVVVVPVSGDGDDRLVDQIGELAASSIRVLSNQRPATGTASWLLSKHAVSARLRAPAAGACLCPDAPLGGGTPDASSDGRLALLQPWPAAGQAADRACRLARHDAQSDAFSRIRLTGAHRPRSEPAAPGTRSQQFARRRGQERSHTLSLALIDASAQVAADGNLQRVKSD